MSRQAPPARLALEDGTVFTGRGFGDLSRAGIDGEVCFNTALSGYQEILTDPSYAGQIVTMTYPLIGNYGVNPRDVESQRCQVAGFVVRELANRPSNFRSTQQLEQWLAEQGVLGIEGVDTRALTRRLRVDGAMRGVLSLDSPEERSDAALVEAARAAPAMEGRNLVQDVSRAEAEPWTLDLEGWAPLQGTVPRPQKAMHVAAVDCGAKLNILRNLVDAGCRVTVMPWSVSAEQIEAQAPDGLFISNGPGDPAAVEQTVETLRAVRGRLPIFGICLGNQLLSRAMGAETFKLKFGHRGANQPVQNLDTEKVEITSQNHGFAVDRESLERTGAEPTHVNLNDGTLEGFRAREEPTFAVQYHPEASPGPHDARYLFDCFAEMMRTGKSPTGEQMDAAQRRRNRVAQGR